MNTMKMAGSGLLIALAMTVTTACHKDLFDKDVYVDIVTGEYPIDTVDPAHDWTLLKTLNVSVTANGDIDDVARVLILSDNPYEVATSQILAERFASKGQQVDMTFEVPKTETQFFAALVSSTEKYYVKAFSEGERAVDFSTGNVINSGWLSAPFYQEFTYLYEENYPMPGDFDYNDVVLRISKRQPKANQLRVTVTVAAVGASGEIGGALRIPSISYADVEDVTISNNNQPLDYDYPLPKYRTTDKIFRKSRTDNQLVINLFEDAHWVLRHRIDAFGSIEHLNYNTVSIPVADESANVATRSRTYTITLKDGVDVGNLTLSDLDPFIIEEYNGTYFEVHTFKYKFDQALWKYYGKNPEKDYEDGLAWALVMPSGQFKWPREGIPLCTYRNGEIFGAYSTYGHSFGEWGRDHTRCLDWWQYPLPTTVFNP